MSQARINDGWRRGGLTRIEVAVLLGVLALLAAFFGPAFQARRISPRKLECLNNIRNVGLAMHNFASANDGRLPPLAGELTFVSEKTGPNGGKLSVGWPIFILPAMDNSALIKKIKQNAVVETGEIGEAERILQRKDGVPDPKERKQEYDSHPIVLRLRECGDWEDVKNFADELLIARFMAKYAPKEIKVDRSIPQN